MNSRNLLFFLIIVFLSLVSLRVIGCAQSHPAEVSVETSTVTSGIPSSTGTTIHSGYREYYPNNDGYSWTYRRTFSDQATINTEKITYSGTANVNGSSVQIAVRQITDQNNQVTTSQAYFKVDNFAVYTIKSVAGINTLVAVFGFPLQVGSNSGVSTVLALEDVSVPAGNFTQCFKLSSTENNYTYYTWLAPNVGMVKAEKVGTSSISTAELVSKNF